MSINYTPIAHVGDVGLLAMPFAMSATKPGTHDRIWIDRGRFLNRYTGEAELLTDPPGFGEGNFGDGIFGWS